MDIPFTQVEAKRIALTIALCLFSLPASGADLETCGRVDNDLDRLACYDKLSGRTPISSREPSAGKWIVTSNKSVFQDTTDVYMKVRSSDVLQCGRPNSQRATLLLRCLENTTAIFIDTACHVTSGLYDYGTVDIRIDDEKAFKIGMDASTDNSALGLWRGGTSIPFIKRLIGKERMVVRFTPFNQSPVTAEFDIAGLEEALKPLRESCGW